MHEQTFHTNSSKTKKVISNYQTTDFLQVKIEHLRAMTSLVGNAYDVNAKNTIYQKEERGKRAVAVSFATGNI